MTTTVSQTRELLETLRLHISPDMRRKVNELLELSEAERWELLFLMTLNHNQAMMNLLQSVGLEPDADGPERCN